VIAEANGVLSSVEIGSATASDIFAVTITNDAPASFALGATLVTWTATDANGNTSTGTQNVTVTDNTAPVLTAPGDVAVEASGVLTPVAIGSASATDIFEVTITNDAPASFPLGTTAVTWTATDANGNASTATQNVTVEDTTAPTLTVELVALDLKKNQGEFRVVFSATDLVDPNPQLVAMLNGVPVTNGQIVVLKDGKKVKIKQKHGELEITAPGFTLDVTATDASGNAGEGSASYAFPSHGHEENGIHRGNDKDDHHADSGNHKSEDKARVEHKDGKKPDSKSNSKDNGKKSNDKKSNDKKSNDKKSNDKKSDSKKDKKRD